MKMQMIKTAVALLVTGFLSIAMAGENQFNKLDADVDGYITTVEAAAHEGLQQGWQGIDTNSDGKIDAAEFSAFEMQAAENKTPEGK